MDIELPKEMRVEYLHRREKDIKEIQAAMVKNDWTVLKTIGHQLKGNGESYGFPALGVLGRELEEAAKQSSVKRAEDILGKLISTVKKLSSELADS